jgi:Ni,Fe-hydrogenase III large subunit
MTGKEAASLSELVAAGTIASSRRSWPRAIVGHEQWVAAANRLATAEWSLFGLWGEPGAVHMAVREAATGNFAILSLPCPAGSFPSISRHHAPALRLERTVRDLFGLVPQGLIDSRAWLDHDRWGLRHPLGERTEAKPAGSSYAFLGAEGHGLHQIPVGPVHAGIIEPGVFMFTANGETVVRLEERLGYVHKGIEGLMIGADLERAARLSARTSGDSTVAYGWAFALAAETALAIEPPRRAVVLRALMAELERIANHLGDFGAICNDASFAILHAQCGILRERVLRTANICFGHRLMRDAIVPGGTACDLSESGVPATRALVEDIARQLPKLTDLYENTASLLDRTRGTGIVRPELAARYACGGIVGRASGRSFDARRDAAYPPYDTLRFEVPVLEDGDVDARVWIRLREIEQSLSLIRQLLDRLPRGPIAAEPAQAASSGGEGVALVEAFRGDVLVWLRLEDGGRVARCHLRDASWFQWPLLEAAIEGNIVADFPLCNKSFNCSYSGHDL